MKECLKATGKAALYFLVYFAAQILIGNIAGAVVSAQLTIEGMAQGQELDYMVLYEQVMEKVTELSALIVLISGVFALFIYWITFLIREKKLLTEVSFQKLDVQRVLPVFLLGISFNIVVSLLLEVVPFPQDWVDSYMANSGSLGEGNMYVNFIAVVIIAPLVEEIVFRGLVYTRLKKGMPALVAAVLSSLLFGVMHGTIIWFCYTFVFGMLLIWCFEKFRSLAANVLLHISFNLTGQVLSMASDITETAMWVIGVVAIAVTVAMVVLIQRKCAVPVIEEDEAYV